MGVKAQRARMSHCPASDSQGVVELGRKWSLGREPIAGANQTDPRGVCQPSMEGVMLINVAEHKTAAVEEDQDRTRIDCSGRAIEARFKRSAWPRDHKLASLRHRRRRPVAANQSQLHQRPDAGKTLALIGVGAIDQCRLRGQCSGPCCAKATPDGSGRRENKRRQAREPSPRQK